MNARTPLPLVLNDDLVNYPQCTHALLIDNSSLKALEQCPRSFEYSKILKRELDGARPALNYGKGLHIGLDVRYKLCGSRDPALVEGVHTENPESKQPVQSFINDAMAMHFQVNPQPDTEFRTLGYAQATMASYNTVYKQEPWRVLTLPNGKPCVEASFAHVLGIVRGVLIIYIGRTDLGIEDNSGIWPVDHKTTSLFGDSFWEDMASTSQFPGYCWAFQNTFGQKPAGFIVNAIRTRRPKREDAYIFEPGDVRRDDFERRAFFISDDRIREWKENALQLIDELLYTEAKGYYPMKTTWCQGKYGPCQFKQVCGLPSHSRPQMLASGNFTDNNWSPLNAPGVEA